MSDLPTDPNCILCMVEAKTNSNSLPGYLKVSDVDEVTGGRRSPVYIASVPKKVILTVVIIFNNLAFLIKSYSLTCRQGDWVSHLILKIR